MTNSPGHLWRDKWTALSGPLSLPYPAQAVTSQDPVGTEVVCDVEAAALAALQTVLHRNVQRFRGGLVFKAHTLCVSPNSRLEGNKEVVCDVEAVALTALQTV